MNVTPDEREQAVWWLKRELPDPDNPHPFGTGLDYEMALRAAYWTSIGIDDCHEAPAEWESELAPEDASQLIAHPSTVPSEYDTIEELEVDDQAWETTDSLLCRVCGANEQLEEREWKMCGQCLVEQLCRICGLDLRHSHGRCDACRKYFERNGRERPRYLALRRSGGASLVEQHKASLLGHDSDPFRATRDRYLAW